MTTLFSFQPTINVPYQFSPTLDGSSYSATIIWNLFGQRWYLSLADGNGAVVLTKALVASANGQQVASLTWDQIDGVVIAETQDPHGYEIGGAFNLTISGAVPDAFNGTYLCAIQDAYTFTYLMTAYPGIATAFGVVEYNIDLTYGLFQTSTLVWRASAGVFEVSP